MRLAVIADIHGNLLALDAVLTDIAARGVDLTVNLGDCVSGPLWPAETAARLMALGLPTGLLYHVLLYRALRSRGVVPERWWLRPTSLHDDIPDEQRGRVLFWCALGAAGFLVIVLGLVVGTVGLWRIC